MGIRSTMCLLFATAAAAACADPGGTLDTPTSTEPSEPDSAGVSLRLTQADGRSGSLRYTLTNHSSLPVHVLRWKTPLQSAPEKLFSVSQDGKEVRYLGSHGRRSAPPKDSDYIEIAPGGELSADFDLSESYDLKQGGTFAVRSSVPARTLLAEADWVNADLDAPLSVEVDAREVGGGDLGVTEQALTFSECSTDQQNFLWALLWSVGGYAADGLSSYRSDPWSDRALRWFGDGAWVGGNVQGILQGVYDRLAAGDINLICDHGHPSCEDGFWARAQNWNDVRLCAPFWNLPNAGADSKVDTVLHELTHFEDTGDYARGVAESYDLARQDQWTASFNADNYAYFYVNAIYP
jgi:peptidyl-Lys metalloendopeptidase